MTLSQSFRYHGHDMTTALEETIAQTLVHPNPSAILGIETHFYNMRITADSCEFELDVGQNLWLHIGRWSRLIREYVALNELEMFIEQGREIYNGYARHGAATIMRFRSPVRTSRKHRWGGCLLGATFIGSPKYKEKPLLTFFSRTTYIGYMGMLDAAIAHTLARSISEPENISFQWIITDCQLHGFKSLPMIYTKPRLMTELNKYLAMMDRPNARKVIPPSWYQICKWQRKIVRDFEAYGHDMLTVEKYGPLRRVKRRWMEHNNHLPHRPPSLPVSQLTFEKSQIDETI